MTHRDTYDAAIIGGGLAGLALSIQLSRNGFRVILFEKEQYPFHRVCGEYISMESWNFLNSLGVDLENLNLPIITQLQFSGLNGKLLEHQLPLGGFGISRYLLDATLANIARDTGVTLLENTKVTDIEYDNASFVVKSSQLNWHARIVCCSFGKRSNLDIKWRRPFSVAANSKLNNYIGVKYHIRGNFPANNIALHIFKNGYCGLVKVEGDKFNLCYLTTAAALQSANGSIDELEKNELCKNPWLKKIITQSTRCNETPVTISQISFDKKSQVENHMLMIGDAAGMITPLCGNGMSMALHASKIATKEVTRFLRNEISREEMERQYEKQWQVLFAGRLRMGRSIQRMFSYPGLTNFIIGAGRLFPSLIQWMVKQTHGKPF